MVEETIRLTFFWSVLLFFHPTTTTTKNKSNTSIMLRASSKQKRHGYDQGKSLTKRNMLKDEAVTCRLTVWGRPFWDIQPAGEEDRNMIRAFECDIMNSTTIDNWCSFQNLEGQTACESPTALIVVTDDDEDDSVNASSRSGTEYTYENDGSSMASFDESSVDPPSTPDSGRSTQSRKRVRSRPTRSASTEDTKAKKKWKRPSYEPTKKEYVERTVTSILCERGEHATNNDANKKYLRIIEEHAPKYLAAPRKEKTGIAKDVVKLIEDEGYCFIKREPCTQTHGQHDRWYRVTETFKWKKVSKCLKETETKPRKQKIEC